MQQALFGPGEPAPGISIIRFVPFVLAPGQQGAVAQGSSERWLGSACHLSHGSSGEANSLSTFKAGWKGSHEVGVHFEKTILAVTCRRDGAQMEAGEDVGRSKGDAILQGLLTQSLSLAPPLPHAAGVQWAQESAFLTRCAF